MYEKATEIDPDFTVAYIAQSHRHQLLYLWGIDKTERRLKKAKAALDKALELQPDLPEAHLCLANYYYRCFLDYDRAQEILERIQRIRPNISPSLLAYIQRRQGKWEQSLKSMEKAIRLDPKYWAHPYQQARTYIHLRKYEEANKLFDRCLSIDPDNLASKGMKALICLLSRGDINEARSILDRLPDSGSLIENRSDLNIYEGKYERALENLKSIPYDSFEGEDRYYVKDLECAYLYFLQNELDLMKTHADKAREDIEKKLSERPEDPRFHAALGRAFAFMGLKNEAIKEGKRAVEIMPVSKDALSGPRYVRNLAMIFVVAGEYEDAIDQLEYLMSIPAGYEISVHLLQLDPMWNPLRENPRFQQLVKKISTKE